ncbi:hypothetical protein ACA910_015258 [Epithemia clementina (nom. ined.)]
MDLVWTELKLKPDPDYGTPLARSSHGVSYLSQTEQLFLYGGEHVARTPLVEEFPKESKDDADEQVAVTIYAWLADLKSQTWKALTVSKNNNNTEEPIPPPRIAHAQAVHETTQTVFIFGGRAGITMQENAMNDLWSWEPSTEQWSLIAPATEESVIPEARSFHRMVCLHDNLYIFGGCGQSSGRLADLHSFHIPTQTWTNLSYSSLLAGRGGANLIPINAGQALAVVAGFIGQESNDGHVFDMTSQKWEPEKLEGLDDLRPRSVCVSASFPDLGVAVIFGGEVDPSERGHEGAGGFANDVVVLNETTGAVITTMTPNSSWPGPRGWSAGDAAPGKEQGKLFVFGGLAGDDARPIRLNDLWQLSISKKR